MADTTDKTDQDKAKAPVEAPHNRERLIAEAQDFFGVEPHEMAGALALAKPFNKQNFTRSEAQRLLKEWDSIAHDLSLTEE